MSVQKISALGEVLSEIHQKLLDWEAEIKHKKCLGHSILQNLGTRGWRFYYTIALHYK